MIKKAIKNEKVRFKLSELMRNTDFDAIRKDKEIQNWQKMKPAGRELL